MVRRALSSAKAPLVLLAVVSVLSLAARVAWLGEPCQSPCTTANDHTLIFDEAYYVNAARVIVGIRPPSGDHYADAPSGTDPNAEHPQGVKLIMAGAIELFGDGPFAWRIGSVIFGSLAILGMFALVRSAGGGRWSALCAATLMACDNLLLIHSRIGTLDIATTAMMIWGLTLYLRGWPLRAGIFLAIGAAFKLVAPYMFAVLVLLELIRVVIRRRDRSRPGQWRPWPSLRRLLIATVTGVVVFFGLLTIMDQIAPPYADAEAKLITGGPFAHLSHMISYAAQQVSPHGPQGIASYPWQWLVDLAPITYLQINPSLPGDGLGAIHPVSWFIGMMSPPIMLLGLPGLAFAAYRLLRRRRGGRSGAGAAPGGDDVPAPPGDDVLEPTGDDVPEPTGDNGDVELAAVAVAWFIGTWVPFEVLSLVYGRTSYIYYMVIVMPGIYVAVTYLLSHAWRRRRRWLRIVIGVWALAVLAAVALMYPFTGLL